MAKKLDELERPKIPGYIDMSKVNSASDNVAAARDAINNLNYDTFKQGSQYGNLKKSYEQQGQTAMKDTLGQVAARTGGMASSYATSAANQSYNNYMQTLEDAARSMFNEEYQKKMDAYNMAQQEYGDAYDEYRDAKNDAWDKYDAENSAYLSDRNFNYQVERDEKSDAEKAKQQAQDDVMAIWQTGETPSAEQLQAAGWYDAATGGVSAAGAAYKYGIDEEISNTNKTEVSNEIDAMLKNGASLNEIEEQFQIGVDGKTWQDVTGMSKAEWQAKQTGDEQGSYKFKDTSEGRAEIVNKLIESGLSLNATDADNFDYIWGDGAYNEIQNMADSIKRVHPGERDANDTFDDQYENMKNLFPGISDVIIFSILEAANPKAFDAWK